MTEEPPGERPKWSITWLLRIQRVGRNRPTYREMDAEPPFHKSMAFKWFAWSIVLLLAIEVAIGVWLGVLPR
jgi:hypothetical protein